MLDPLKLYFALQERGLTDCAFAERIGVEPSVFSMWMNQRARPACATIYRMAQALGLGLDDLVQFPFAYDRGIAGAPCPIDLRGHGPTPSTLALTSRRVLFQTKQDRPVEHLVHVVHHAGRIGPGDRTYCGQTMTRDRWRRLHTSCPERHRICGVCSRRATGHPDD